MRRLTLNSGEYVRIPETLSGVLELIDWLGVNVPAVAWGLWTVLTALRGPDNETAAIKPLTTAKIRRSALPMLAERAGAMVAAEGVGESTPEVSELARYAGRHFALHTVEAMDVLRRERDNG